ncbi:MAG TPA: glycosyltransferase family 4 protein, partial [Polyangiaceae bacterium]|nr:glycosyltransferase family 4 protein [Polyangiaceae bacterium]
MMHAPPTPRALVVASLADSLVRFRGDLLQTLVAQGVSVHAAAPGLSPTSECAQTLSSWGVVPHQVSLTRTGLNPLQDLATLADLYRLLRRIKPTYLLAYTVKPVLYALLAARLAGVPETTALITGLGYAFASEADNPKRRALQLLLQRLYRTALRGAKRVVFQNPDDRALFVQLGLANPVQCELVNGSGVNLEHFDVAPLPPLPGPVHFVLIARLIRDKGIQEFIEAGRLVRRSQPGVQLHLVGGLDTNPAAITRAELERWVADGSVVYHGQLEDVRPALARAHVFVLPSYYREGVPRTILEAMAMGRPVITCDAPGCREAVQDGKNGYLVPIKNASALADAMLRFVEQPARIASMGAAGRELA